MRSLSLPALPVKRLVALVVLAACTRNPPAEEEPCAAGTVAEGDVCVPEACGASFDPAGADLVVAASGGTHTDLASAIAAATDGQVIALDRGVWEAPGLVDRSVSVVGRCPDAVVEGRGSEPAFAIADPDVTLGLRNLTVQDGGGVLVEAGRAEIEDAVLTGGVGAGAHARGPSAVVVLRRSLVTETVERDDKAPGVWVEEEAEAELEEVEITLTRGYGVLVDGDRSRVMAAGLVIADLFTADEIPDNGTVGVSAQYGGAATLTDVDIAGVSLASILVQDASVEVHGAYLHDNQLDLGLEHGRGISVLRGGHVLASDLVTYDLWEASVYVEDGTLDLTGGLLERTRSQNLFGDTWGHGTGVWVDWRGSARVEGVTVEESYGYGFAAAYDGELELVDCVVTGARKSASTTLLGDAGIFVGWDATVSATRTVVEGGVERGILVGEVSEEYEAGDVATLSLVDSEITLHTDESGYNGYGIEIRHGARVTIEGSRIHDNFGPGVFGPGQLDVEVTIRDSEIRANRNAGIQAYGGAWTVERTTVAEQAYDEQWGGAAGVFAWGAAMTLVDVDIRDNEGIGLLAYGLGGVVRMTGGSVTGGRLYADTTAVQQLGWGVVADNFSDVTLDGVRVDGNRGLGVLGLPNSTLTLTGSDVGGTEHSPQYNVAVGLLGSRSDVTLEDTRVHDNAGPGIAVFGGTVTATSCELDHNGYAGGAVSSGTLRVDTCDVHHNLVDASDGGGVGLYGASGSQPVLEVVASTIHDHPYAAVWATGGSVRVSDSDLEGGEGVVVRDELIFHGNAVFGLNTERWDGESGLLIERSALHDAVGPAVMLHHGSATLSEVTFTGNASDVLQQGCDESVLPPEGAPDAVVCPDTDRLVDSLFFSLYLEDIAVEEW